MKARKVIEIQGISRTRGRRAGRPFAVHGAIRLDHQLEFILRAQLTSSPTVDRLWESAIVLPYMPLSGTSKATARLDSRGRLVLPLELRRRLGLSAGDEVRISEEADGVLRVESRRAAARALIGLAGLPGSGVLDDLREERSRQAAAEERDVAGTRTSARKATVDGELDDRRAH